MAPIGGIDLLVLGLVLRFHIPVEPVLQPQRFVFILYPLELFRAVAQCPGGVNQVRFGLRDEPVGQDIWDLLKFLGTISAFGNENLRGEEGEKKGRGRWRGEPAGRRGYTPDRTRRRTYPIDQVKHQAHGDAEFLKVQLPIAVHVGQIPDLLQLIIAEATIPEHRGRLGVVQARLAIGQRRKDLPVSLDFPLLDSFCRHGVSMRWY